MKRILMLAFFGGLPALTGVAQVQPPPGVARFHFREPNSTTYRVESDGLASPSARTQAGWVKAWPEHAAPYPVEFGARVVVQLKPGTTLSALLNGTTLRLARTVAPDLFILQAPDPVTALAEAQRLATRPEALISCPVQR